MSSRLRDRLRERAAAVGLASVMAWGCGRIGFEAGIGDGGGAGPQLPGGNLRSIGTAGQLGTVTATGVAGSTTLATSAEPPGLGPGDRVTCGATEVHVARAESSTRLRLQEALPRAIIDEACVVARAYASVADWETARGGNLVAEDRAEVGLLYADGPFRGAAASAMIRGSVTDPTRNFTLMAAPGSDHRGVPGAGVVFDGEGQQFFGIDVEQDHTVISGIELMRYGTPPAGNGDYAIRVAAAGVVIERVLIHDATDTTTGIRSSNIPEPTSFTIRSSAIWNMDRGVLADQPQANLLVEHVTVFNTVNEGIIAWNGRIEARNTISAGGRTASFFATTGTVVQTATISSDGTATGSGSLANVPASTLFVSTAAGFEDLHLLAGSPAEGAGTQSVTGGDRDVDGDPRPTGGAWDIGADER